MTALCTPAGLLAVLDGAAVGIFGILLSAAFCPICWTRTKAELLILKPLALRST